MPRPASWCEHELKEVRAESQHRLEMLQRQKAEIARLENDIATERDAWAKDCAENERLKTELLAVHKLLTKWSDANKELEILLRAAANEIDELGFPSKADEFLRALEEKP